MIKPKYYKNDIFKLYVADNVDVIPNINYNNSVIITSPPYNLNRSYDKYNDDIIYDEYILKLYKTFKLLYDYIEDDTRVIVILKDNFSDFKFLSYDFYDIMKKIGYRMYNYFIAESSHISKFTAWGSWKSASCPRVRVNFEVIQVYYKKSYKRKNKGKSTISADEFKEYTISLIKDEEKKLFSYGINKKEHPAQFTPILIDRLVKLYTFENDTIIDIFCGVGNAGVSALRNKRKFIGIDISKKYIDIAYKKLINVLQS